MPPDGTRPPDRPARPDVHGVVAVVAMPFDVAGAIDHAALEREVAYLLGADVDGLAIGFGSESPYLTDRERDAVLGTIVREVGGRCPVAAPIVVSSGPAARDRAAAAADIGADLVMVTPPPGAPGAILAFFESLAADTSCGIMLQDAPTFTGTVMSDELVLELVELPTLRAVKVETADAYARIARLRDRVPRPVALLGGNGGVQLMSELRAGSDGTMPGAANAAELVRIVRLWEAGHAAEAEMRFGALQPLLVMAAATPESFLFVQKELLRREGILETTTLRAGTIAADAPVRAELAHFLERAGR